MEPPQLTDAQRAFVTTFLNAKPETQTDDGSNLAATWQKLHAALTGQVADALKGDHPEATKIRASMAYAEEKADANDYPAAIASAERLTALLAAGGSGETPTDVPQGVVAFQKSRIMWINAKRDMKSGLESFRAAVLKQSSDDEDSSDIATATDSLLEDFNAFDTQLEDHLDAITQTAEGPDRARLKKAADTAIQQYIKALDGPFLSIVDSNPFVSVNIAARGRQSLSAIRATLA